MPLPFLPSTKLRNRKRVLLNNTIRLMLLKNEKNKILSYFCHILFKFCFFSGRGNHGDFPWLSTFLLQPNLTPLLCLIPSRMTYSYIRAPIMSDSPSTVYGAFSQLPAGLAVPAQGECPWAHRKLSGKRWALSDPADWKTPSMESRRWFRVSDRIKGSIAHDTVTQSHL